jgi:hypothetical protein
MVAGLITVTERFYKRHKNTVACPYGKDVLDTAGRANGDEVAGVALD